MFRTTRQNLIATIVCVIACIFVSTKGYSKPVDLAAYRLQPGDKITVTVIGERDLSGDHVIDGVGSINLPLVGSVQVGGLTIDECRRRLSDRFAGDYLKHPEIDVYVKEFKPIYVYGDVRAPGSFPFRFGLSAVSAVALAGGFGSPDKQGASIADRLSAEERMNKLQLSRQNLRITLARLQAELNGDATFDPPVAEADVLDERWLESERELLSSSLAAHRRNMALLEEQSPRLRSAMRSLQDEVDAGKRQLELTHARLAKYDRLSSEGLANSARKLDLMRDVARLEGNIARLTAERARLEVSLGEQQIEIQEAIVTRQSRIREKISETRLRLSEITVELPAAQQLVESLKWNAAPDVANGAAAQNTYRIFLFREVNGEKQEVPVALGHALEPGDVLHVRWEGKATGETSPRQYSREKKGSTPQLGQKSRPDVTTGNIRRAPL